MIGTRIDSIDGEDFLLRMSKTPGSYGKVIDEDMGKEHWYCCTPNGEMGNLGAHKVTEHEDRTITVSPSILVSIQLTSGGRKELWHGWLERGVWRAC